MFNTFLTIESSTPRKIRSLRNINKATNIAYFVYKSQSFEKAEKEEIWRRAMDEEITTIKKNNT